MTAIGRLTLLAAMPALIGILSLFVSSNRLRRLVLVLTAFAHTLVTLSVIVHPAGDELFGNFRLDGIGTLFLVIVSLLFLMVSVYAAGYLSREEAGERDDFQGAGKFYNAPETRLSACLLFFLSSMTVVCVSAHLGAIWVGIEATTLATAPLIYFHRHRRSLEAAWKYLMICSVGIALALLGNILLAVSAQGPGGGEVVMTTENLVAIAPALNIPWFKAAFIFALIGYGTKMGLAPMHTWLPDAHGESPALVSALLSGALLNCAFLGIMRFFQVALAAGLESFARELLVLFGLVSMGTAAVFIANQGDFKRMLAYSSVEHVGIMALGLGIGKAAVFGAVLHALGHSLAKGMLFLTAGNIMSVYRSKSCYDTRGTVHVLPFSGTLWVAGFAAIVGLPPFSLFLSEFIILRSAFAAGKWLVGGLYALFLGIIFVGMSAQAMRMAFGNIPPAVSRPVEKESLSSVLPPLLLGLCVLGLGVYMPGGVFSVLKSAAESLGWFGTIGQ